MIIRSNYLPPFECRICHKIMESGDTYWVSDDGKEYDKASDEIAYCDKCLPEVHPEIRHTLKDHTVIQVPLEELSTSRAMKSPDNCAICNKSLSKGPCVSYPDNEGGTIWFCRDCNENLNKKE